MSYETILYEVREQVARITLNRPETYNALTTRMYTEMIDALKKAQKDTSVRAVLLTGTGKAFCSGADLTEFDLSQKLEIGELLRNGLNQLVLTMRATQKPIVCALNGVAAGAGSSIALACDVRIASDNATFVFAAFLNIGLVPDSGLTYFLPQLVGASRAMELILFADAGNRVTMQKALEYGLVSQVVAADSLADEADRLANRLANMATRAVALTKRAVYRSMEHSLAEALDYEAWLQDAAFKTGDVREGITAFIEKRPPTFKGE